MNFQDKKSLKNYFWELREFDERLALAFYQKLEISEIVSRLLALKNIELHKAESYLNPTLRHTLPNPYHLLDMEKAVNATFETISNNKKICIFGDYDVDGATASALMKRFFGEIGIDVDVYIPDRMREGYGLNIMAIEKIKASSVDLLITVDCGIASIKEVEFANEIGLDVIVTDHHLGSDKLPNALAVVDPNRLDETTEYKNLAGVGVAFLFCIALNSRLREEGFYREKVIKSEVDDPSPPEKEVSQHLPYREDLKEKAIELRQKITKAEKKIWYDVLSNKKINNFKFLKQKPILDYIVDFYCAELGLIIEIDDRSHNDKIEYDEKRTERLEELGLKFIRYSNMQIYENLEEVYEDLERKTIERKNFLQSQQTPLLPTATTPPFQGGKKRENVSEPNLLNLLDLVALGTVCDVVPLTGLNRTFVKQGLKVLRRRGNLGIKTLVDVAGLDELINVYHLGFALGPRINAGGRVGSSEMGSRLLHTKDDLEALGIAEELNRFNQERQNIEKDVLENAIAKIENQKLYEQPFIFVAGQDWHEGVIGIVASRIKDKYNKPTAVLSISNGIAKASCRSVHGVNLGSVIIEAKLNEMLLSGGGHAMAGGFSVEELKIPLLHNFFCRKLEKEIGIYLNNKTKKIDLVLECKSLTINLAKEIEKLGPYGAGNHKPKIVLKNASILKSDLIGKDKNHLRLIIADDDTVSLSKAIPAMFFGLDKQEKVLGDILQKRGNKLNLLGDISVNRWAGMEKIQFIIEDVMI